MGHCQVTTTDSSQCPSPQTPATVVDGRLLVARNAAWRDFRRSHLSEDHALFSSCRLYFHRLVGTTRRRFWRSWQDGVARLRMQDPRACASRIRRCFRLPDCRRAPHASMRWRSSSVGSARACDHWRTHFSSVTASGGYDDFSPDFSRSITRRFFDLTADVSPGPFDALFFSVRALQCFELVSRLCSRAGRPSVQCIPAALAVLAPHASQVCQLGPQMERGPVPGSSAMLSPSSSTGNQPSQTTTDPFLWRPAHSRSSSGWCMAGSHRTSRIASMSARAAFVGEQMLACTSSWTHCGCVRTCTPSAPSSTSVQLLTPLGLRRRWSGCTRLGSLEACGAQWPLSFVAPSRRSEFAGTYLRRGSTPVLLRDACSHHFFSTYWSTALQPPSDALHLVRLDPHSDLRFTCQLYADDLVIYADSEADLQAALDAVT